MKILIYLGVSPSQAGAILGDIYGEKLLYMGETNDQMMPKEGDLYKRIFQ